MATILLLDDDNDFLEMSRVGLPLLGLEVHTFSDPYCARDAFARNPRQYLAVVSDIVMPGMSGTSFAAEIRALSGSVPIVLISGMSETLNSAALETIGRIEVLTKPVTPRALANAVHRGYAEF